MGMSHFELWKFSQSDVQLHRKSLTKSNNRTETQLTTLGSGSNESSGSAFRLKNKIKSHKYNWRSTATTPSILLDPLRKTRSLAVSSCYSNESPAGVTDNRKEGIGAFDQNNCVKQTGFETLSPGNQENTIGGQKRPQDPNQILVTSLQEHFLTENDKTGNHHHFHQFQHHNSQTDSRTAVEKEKKEDAEDLFEVATLPVVSSTDHPLEADLDEEVMGLDVVHPSPPRVTLNFIGKKKEKKNKNIPNPHHQTVARKQASHSSSSVFMFFSSS